MFTLSADLSASQGRLARWCELSFMLGGMPLDPTPYLALTAEVPAMNTPAFRIVQDDPVRRKRLARQAKQGKSRPWGSWSATMHRGWTGTANPCNGWKASSFPTQRFDDGTCRPLALGDRPQKLVTCSTNFAGTITSATRSLTSCCGHRWLGVLT